MNLNMLIEMPGGADSTAADCAEWQFAGRPRQDRASATAASVVKQKPNRAAHVVVSAVGIVAHLSAIPARAHHSVLAAHDAQFRSRASKRPRHTGLSTGMVVAHVEGRIEEAASPDATPRDERRPRI